MLSTNRSWTYHFTYDVTVTSFYKGLTPYFHTTSTIYSDMCVPSFVLLRLREGGDIARKKMGAKICPQRRLAGGEEAQRPPGSFTLVLPIMYTIKLANLPKQRILNNASIDNHTPLQCVYECVFFLPVNATSYGLEASTKTTPLSRCYTQRTGPARET